MFYDRVKKDHMRVLVEEALAAYQKDINNSGAGYSILRYSSRNLISVDESVNADVFLSWYPLNQGYIILRLATQGKLKYKETMGA